MARSQSPQTETRGQMGLQRRPVPGIGQRRRTAGHFCGQSFSPARLVSVLQPQTQTERFERQLLPQPQPLEEELKLERSLHSVPEVNAFHCETSDYL